jgi:hypothetical protein
MGFSLCLMGINTLYAMSMDVLPVIQNNSAIVTQLFFGAAFLLPCGASGLGRLQPHSFQQRAFVTS